MALFFLFEGLKRIGTVKTMITLAFTPAFAINLVFESVLQVYLTRHLLVTLQIRTMDFDRLCKDIIGLDLKIRFAGVCDDVGEIIYGGQRKGITDLLSKEESRRSNLQAIARWALRDSLSSKVGEGIYAIAEYEKIKRITFPIEESHLLLVTTEVDADHNKIIGDILTLLRK